MNSQYVPLEDRCLVKELKKSDIEKTNSGIYMPGDRPEKYGEVVAVGEGRYSFENGVFIPTVLKKGDLVLYLSSAGLPLDLDMGEDGEKQEYTLMREQDILMLVKKGQQ